MLNPGVPKCDHTGDIRRTRKTSNKKLFIYATI